MYAPVLLQVWSIDFMTRPYPLDKLDIKHISTSPFIVQLAVYIVCFNFYCMLCIIFSLFYRGPQGRLAFVANCANFFKYSRFSLSGLRLSRITAYLEDRNLKSGYKILWKRKEIAPREQFLPFSTIFSIYISN